MRGRLAVIGGHSRIGKTATLNAIRRLTPEMKWYCLKISSHHHPPDADLATGAAELARMLDEGRNLLVEPGAGGRLGVLPQRPGSFAPNPEIAAGFPVLAME